jgi:hypothetical protein
VRERNCDGGPPIRRHAALRKPCSCHQPQARAGHRRSGRCSEQCWRNIEPAPNMLSRRTDELSAISRNLFQRHLVKSWDRCQFGFVREQQPLGGIDAAQNKRLDGRRAETTCSEHGAGSEQLIDFGDAEIVPLVANVAHVPGSPWMSYPTVSAARRRMGIDQIGFKSPAKGRGPRSHQVLGITALVPSTRRCQNTRNQTDASSITRLGLTQEQMRHWWVNQNQTYRHEVQVVSLVAQAQRQQRTKSLL